MGYNRCDSRRLLALRYTRISRDIWYVVVPWKFELHVSSTTGVERSTLSTPRPATPNPLGLLQSPVAALRDTEDAEMCGGLVGTVLSLGSKVDS